MKSNLIIALTLCSLSWISSGSLSHTVQVKPGHDVTLLCPNISKSETMTFWFRLVNRTQASCVAVMTRSYSKADFCQGFHDKKFDMRSNTTTLILKVKQVDSSDSGLYFCGFSEGGKPLLDVIYLNVGEKDSDKWTDNEEPQQPPGETTYVLILLILGGFILFLPVAVIVVKNCPIVSGDKQNPQHEKVDCDDLKAAALSVFSPAVRSRRPASQRQVETHVTYAASR
ncbi:uncharacterized protein LOC114846411 isoform X2 [Betta splendens]|uniref:Uncharacterized protein LOC114846411 isoform X2 n=1 Tax=Betta splendens TaxID=158456 RepID=A0A6P7LCH2_BETSP|nr:uncharacterized protein LOC114846411 isoform X2 [Betta splendens]